MAYGNYSALALYLINGNSLLSEPSETSLQAIIPRAFRLKDFAHKQYPRYEKPITGVGGRTTEGNSTSHPSSNPDKETF